MAVRGSGAASNPMAPASSSAEAHVNARPKSDGDLCLVSNIPDDFHSADLRRFFSSFVEEARFEVFHYKRRKQRIVPKESASAAAAAPASSSEAQPPPVASSAQAAGVVRRCCVVRVGEGVRREFQRRYHGRFWENAKDVRSRLKCIIKPVSASGVVEDGEDEPPKTPYLSRKEARAARRAGGERLDLGSLAELRPPPLLPRGNVGTPTRDFLELIAQCKLPGRYVSALGVGLAPRQGCALPFRYAPGRKRQRREAPEDAPAGFESGSDSDDDLDAEEWERHEAMNDMPEKDIERHDRREADEYLYEEPTEVTWDKGSSGLVFFTDACHWDELVRGENEDRERDDWDVDTGAFTAPERSDNAARYGYRPIYGIDTDAADDGMTRVKRGVPGRLMARMGWAEGGGLGRRGHGIATPVAVVANADRRGLGCPAEGMAKRGRAAGMHPDRHSPTPMDAPPVNVATGLSLTCWRRTAPEGPLVIGSVLEPDYVPTRRRGPAPPDPAGSFPASADDDGPYAPPARRPLAWGDAPDPLLPSLADADPPALFPAPARGARLIRFVRPGPAPAPPPPPDPG